jgi:hypothetical protein
MLKQTVSFALAAALLFATAARPANASPQQDKEARRVEKVKERLAKWHERGKRRVVVRLKDGRKLKGRVADVTQSEFVLADKKTGAFNTFRYDEVKEVRLARPSHQWVGPVVMFGFLTIVSVAVGAGLDE